MRRPPPRTTGRIGMPRISSRVSTAGLPTRRPMTPRSTWKHCGDKPHLTWGSHGRRSHPMMPLRSLSQASPSLEVLPALGVAFEHRAVPLSAFGCRLVGALKDCDEHGIRVTGGANVLVRQEELAVFPAVVGIGGSDRVVGEAIGLWVGIGVEGTFLASAGPEAAAAQLPGVALHHHPVTAIGCAARVLRGGAAGEPRACQVHGSPEVVHRADLAGEP